MIAHEKGNMVYLQGFGYINWDMVVYVIPTEDEALEIKLLDGTVLKSDAYCGNDMPITEEKTFNIWEYYMDSFHFTKQRVF